MQSNWSAKHARVQLHIRFTLALVLALLATQGLSPALPVQAAQFAVTSTNDAGAGTLRQALIDANAAAGADTITFDLPAGSTIVLAAPLPPISGDLLIAGPGAEHLTVSGNRQVRIFTILDGAITISGMTLRDGKAQGGAGGSTTAAGGGGGGAGLGGGMLVNAGTISLIDVAFEANAAIGGAGGAGAGGATGGGGGGGGANGAGGSGSATTAFGGGGGGFLGAGGSADVAFGGGGGGFTGRGGGQAGAATALGGGGAGPYGAALGGGASGAAGGGGGGGSADFPGASPGAAGSAVGGTGGFGGGGGGAAAGAGGAGGDYGGGGGAAAIAGAEIGGAGGFGGGGGGGIDQGGAGGFGGGGGGAGYGTGAASGEHGGAGIGVNGGGGAGLGGGLFVRRGHVNLVSVRFADNYASGGAGAGSGERGRGKGGALFVASEGTVVSTDGAPGFSNNGAQDGASSDVDNANVYGLVRVAAGAIHIKAGNAQSAYVGEVFGTTLQVEVQIDGAPAPFAPVKFQIIANGGASATFPGGVPAVMVFANRAGVATAPNLTANQAVGSFSVTAAVAGVSNVAQFGLLNRGRTTTTVTAAPQPSAYGEEVAFTAQVAPHAPATGTPGGAILFKLDGAPLGTVMLVNGTATIQSNALAVGDHTITAVYGGSTIFAGSESAPASHHVNKAGATVALTVSPAGTVFGQGLALSAKVSAQAPGAGTPGGAVTFKYDAAVLGSVTLVDGVATFGVNGLPVGAYNITAEYGGSIRYETSISTVQAHTVAKAATSTALSVHPNPSIIGASVLFTATVTTTAPGSGMPEGLVLFRAGDVTLGASPLVNGVATLNTATLDVGRHIVTAHYAGGANFSASTSAAQDQIVKRKTRVTLAITPNPIKVGEEVTMTVRVEDTPPGLDQVSAAALTAPTGAVEIVSEDGTVLGAVTLEAGGAIHRAILPGGVHHLQARYAGDAVYGDSTSAVTIQTVTRYRSTTSLARSALATGIGQALILLAEVMPAEATGAPSGTMTFLVDGVVAGVVPLVEGKALLTANTLTVGTHLIAAEYSGDSRYDPSGANPVFHTVDSSRYLYLPTVAR